ncbi:SgcJ/EcaC family oxidoreductase [Larkinella insperata]|uniref:SgcJ/EcaC family oxidoreductase n=1 Tax=Larkinella insperata TaxID=332158 RepID=A0ABW3Q8P8_9BACT|nr:SgcJ/EcaC family oxidoreductase [Larkinella insperata]
MPLLLITPLLHAQSRQDSTAVQAIIQDQVTAWNQGDAVAYSKQFAREGTFTNIMGLSYTGHKAFLERHDQIFKGVFRNTVLQQKIISLRFIRPDVATVETLTRVSGLSAAPPPGIYLDNKGRFHTRLLQIMTKSATGWEVVTYHNVDLKSGVPVPEID